MAELRPQLSSTMTSLQERIVDEQGRPTLAFHRMLERLVEMNANDPAFMHEVGQEVSAAQVQELSDRLAILEARDLQPNLALDADEIRAELASLRAAVDDGANGLQGAREEAQTQLQQIVGQIEEASLLGKPSGSLADRDSVGTSQIDPNSITGIDGTSTDYALVSTAITQVELARHTQDLTSGSAVLIDVRLAGQSVTIGFSYTYTVASGGRDLVLRLIRDPDGAPVEIGTHMFRENATGGPTAGGLFSYGFSEKDTGHGGGSVTYALVLSSYTTGTTTLASTTLAITTLATNINAFEAKR